MNKRILKIATKEFNKLKSQYNGFINVGVDNWRGYRFIFDVEPCKNCRNGCSKCPLFLLLKNKKEGLFSTGLYRASKKDRELFGPQRYLNCKSLQQYQECYSNFLVKEANSEREIRNELKLIRDFKIIFSRKTDNLEKLEKDFRESVIRKTLKMARGNKRKIIIKLARLLLGYN